MVFGTHHAEVDYKHTKVDSNTFTMDNAMPESTLSHSQGLWICPLDFLSDIFNVDVNSFSLIYQSLHFHGVNDNGDHRLGRQIMQERLC
jgi:hypothetical protein